jgi:hypothetical protein
MTKPQTDILISVDDDHLQPDQLKSVVGKLQEQGVNVKNWDDLGVITGSVAPDKDLAPLKDVPGVRHVRPQRTFQVAPPTSKLQ